MIVATLGQLVLPLAQRSARVDLSEVSRSIMEGRGEVPFNLLLLGVGLMLLVISGASLYRAAIGGRWRRRPTWLALQLGRRVGLGIGDLWLLARIARHQRLPCSLVLMLSPGTLEHHAEQFAADMSAQAREHLGRRLKRIRHKLFEADAASLDRSAAKGRVDGAGNAG